jgi:hypothetical protein
MTLWTPLMQILLLVAQLTSLRTPICLNAMMASRVGEGDDIGEPLMIAFILMVGQKLLERVAQGTLANENELIGHASFTVRTQRSAEDALRRQGARHGCNRIARLMRKEGLCGRQKGRYRVQTTDSNHTPPHRSQSHAPDSQGRRTQSNLGGRHHLY